MSKIGKSLLICLFLFQFNCFGQTNNFQLKLRNLFTNRVYTIESGTLYGIKTKQIGGFLDLYTPIGNTNSDFGLGISFAYLGDFYNANINGKIGINIPYTSFYTYLEGGGGLDINTGDLINQDFIGIVYKKQFKERILTIGIAFGKITNYEGYIIGFGGSFTF